MITREFSSNLPSFRSYLIALRLRIKLIKTNKKISYYNVSSAFDIEASSFYENFVIRPENKRGIMYAWIFGIDDYTIMGRTWDDFIELNRILEDELGLSQDKRLIIYVHNLGYDFQFFRPYLTFDRVFALDMREPLQAVSEGGLEYRCSYKLSGYSLAKVGEHLTRHKVNKMVGDLDYTLLRTPITPLTPKEKNYILHDGLVLLAYIKEEIEDHGDITKIPLTKTGKVRTYCRNACLHTYKSHKKKDRKFSRYSRLMGRLTINSVHEYKALRQTFMGGYTHGNHLHIGEVCDNVASLDETSAYPYVMVSQLFPMSKGELIDIKSKEDFLENLKYYHSIFTATFYNIDETFTYDHYISISKCIEKEGVVADNGRLVKADKITILITNIDYQIIQKTYKWSKLTIRNFRRYKRGLLPRDFILSILDLYEKKTALKGVEDKIIEYQQSKENINGCFGMTVTDICREEIIYNDYFEEVEDGEAWEHQVPDYEKMIEKYNKDKKRFLYYPWGIFVTAHARKIIWDAIIENGEDHRYTDTDSVKLTNYEKHKDYYAKYNRRLLARLKKVMDLLNIPFEKCTPKTIKGEIKPIGVFEYEGTYKRFKYLGAKRYMVEKWDEDKKRYIIDLTVSGINKFVCVPYLEKTYGSNTKIFEAFNDGLIIPKGYTGKQIHTYIDYETEGDTRDYLGNDYHYHELSGIHMEDTEYSLSMSEEFLSYLLGRQRKVQ